jgi:nucleoside-diphosphate-sugar epimerase
LWLLTILLEGRSLRPYNVGSDRPVTILDLARSVADTATPPLPVRVLGAAVPPAARDRYVPNVDRIASELGLSQTIDLHTAIIRTKRWYAGSSREPASD